MTAMEIVISIIAFFGSFFVFVAGLGVLRFPDIYMRMHAATKAGSLGLGLLLLGVAIQNPEPLVLLKCIVIISFIFLSAPIAAHMIGRASYLHRTELWDKTKSDALKGKYAEDHSRLDS